VRRDRSWFTQKRLISSAQPAPVVDLMELGQLVPLVRQASSWSAWPK